MACQVRGVAGLLRNRIEIVHLYGARKNDGIHAALPQCVEQLNEGLRIRRQGPSVRGNFMDRCAAGLECRCQCMICRTVSLHQDRAVPDRDVRKGG
jgi:hypothetical protein